MSLKVMLTALFGGVGTGTYATLAEKVTDVVSMLALTEYTEYRSDKHDGKHVVSIRSRCVSCCATGEGRVDDFVDRRTVAGDTVDHAAEIDCGYHAICDEAHDTSC